MLLLLQLCLLLIYLRINQINKVFSEALRFFRSVCPVNKLIK